MQCRDFVNVNYADLVPTHWFHSIEDQTHHRACSLHPYAVDGCDACPTGRGMADFAIAGSPCHPFSQQRSQRFSQKSVEQHGEYMTTMSSLLEWANHFEPKCWVMEQVRGFDMPFQKQGTETPLQRHRWEGYRRLQFAANCRSPTPSRLPNTPCPSTPSLCLSVYSPMFLLS